MHGGLFTPYACGMEGSLWVALVVAVLAAAASIFAAARAGRSADRAQESADSIDRRAHLVEAHDYQERTFREAYVGLMSALESWDKGNSDATAARLNARLEVLAIHPWTTDEMASQARREVLAFGALLQGHPVDPKSSAENARALRAAVRARIKESAGERLALLTSR